MLGAATQSLQGGETMGVSRDILDALVEGYDSTVYAASPRPPAHLPTYPTRWLGWPLHVVVAALVPFESRCGLVVW